MQASANSWKLQPFNEGIPLEYTAAFAADEFACLTLGLIPRAMEDKWFIYYEDPYLFLHRSWTGQPVYRLAFRKTHSGAEVIEALWSKELALDSQSDVEYQRAFWIS